MTALVVGAGPGMGSAIAAAIGPAHGPVGLVARRAEALDAIAASLAQRSVAAQGFPADITDAAVLISAIGAARRALGPPSVVVFNASLYVPGPPSSMSVADFETGLATGLTGALITLQATVGDLRAAAPDACLIFTGGGAAYTPTAAMIGLGIQKAGLRHLALAAAEELAPQGVHVGLVTIRGTVAHGGPFDPELIAPVYAQLAAPATRRPVEVTFTADGPDWTPAAG